MKLRRTAAGAALGVLGLGIFGLVLPIAPAVGQAAEEEESEFTSDIAALEQYGWWNKAQQPPPVAPPAAQPPVPPPPDAPDNGIFLAHDVVTTSAPAAVVGAPALVEGIPGTVGGTTGAPMPATPLPEPIGPTAFGAVRYSIPEGAEGELTLRLSRPASAAPTVLPVVLACPILSPWDGVQNGRFDAAPGYECSSSVPGVVAGDTVTFVLPATASTDGMSFDLAIVPAGDQPFRMAIDAPSDESLLLTSVPEGLDEEAFEGSLEDFEGDFEAEGALEEGLTGDEFAAGDLGFVDDGSFGAAGDASAATRPRTPGGQLAVPAALTLNPFAPDASRGERLMSVLLLLAIGVGLWWIGGKPTRAPRLLGSLGGGQAAEVASDGGKRGIGRFARIRTTERPPRLF